MIVFLTAGYWAKGEPNKRPTRKMFWLKNLQFSFCWEFVGNSYSKVYRTKKKNICFENH